METVEVYLSLGSNLGNREENILKAIDMIKEQIGDVTRQSALLHTEPWGFESGNEFVNAAICVKTTLLPIELLHKTQAIERQMGRFHKSINRQYQDRIIDIDILLYGDLKMETPELTIPHPLMHERDFVMTPLREILENS